jgi:hypothetical protein
VEGGESKTRKLLFVIAAAILLLVVPTAPALAADSGWKAPSLSIPSDGTGFTNPDNAFSSDDVYATVDVDGQQQQYTNFGLSIPDGATINGIRVRVEAHHSTGHGLRRFVVDLSWNGGTNWTSTTLKTGQFGTSDTTRTVGSTTQTWGRTWSADDFTDANFRVRLTTDLGSGTLSVDYVVVRVYYTATHTINASADTGGSISPSGAVTVTHGANQTFTITPSTATGYIVSDVLVDGSPQGRINSYTFTNVTADHTIDASFDGGWKAPSQYANDYGITNADRGYTSDEQWVVFNNRNDRVDYYRFVLNVPSEATIDGIEVGIEASCTGSRTFDVSLSWNSSTDFTSVKNTGNFTTEKTVILGGHNDTWGKSGGWSPADLSDDNFRVRLDATSSGGSRLNLDCVQVKVYYTLPTYTLTVAIVGNGSVSKNPDQPTYTHGTEVELTATADPGWTFDNWSGDLSGSTNPDTIIMDGNKLVTATFNEVNLPPVLDPIGDKTVDEETLLSFTISATDPDIPANTLSYSIESGTESGMSLNSATGEFTWTPTEAQGPGDYDVTFRVTDDGTPNLYDEETITITVNEVNLPPELTGVPATATIDELIPYSFDADTTDADIPPQALTFSLVGAPAGASIDPATGVFSWTPTEEQGPGTYPFTVRVTDGVANTDALITLTVNEVNLPPVLDPTGDKTGDEETLLSFTISATDPDIPANTLSYSIESGSESGMSLNSATGEFTWTPTEAQGPGDYDVTFRVTDDGTPNLYDEETITITVNEVQRLVGSGGGGGSGVRKYLTVDFLGEITKESISSSGRLLNSLVAPSLDGLHVLEMEKGTTTLSQEGKVIKLITITEAATPLLPENIVIVGKVYDFEPSNITFSKPVRLTLGYNMNELPKNAISVALAYYTVESGWVELEAESGEVAEIGKLTAPVEHFTIFAVLASVPPPPPLPSPSPPPPAPAAPAAFELSNLSIMPSFSKVWGLLPFAVKTGEQVTITVDVTNYGGQEGNYDALLKINGVTQGSKEITLDAGQRQKIDFTVTENEPGSYTVEIGNLSGEFQSLLRFNWWLIAGLIAAFILLAWLAWYYWYYKEGRKTH